MTPELMDLRVRRLVLFAELIAATDAACRAERRGDTAADEACKQAMSVIIFQLADVLLALGETFP